MQRIFLENISRKKVPSLIKLGVDRLKKKFEVKINNEKIVFHTFVYKTFCKTHHISKVN